MRYSLTHSLGVGASLSPSDVIMQCSKGKRSNKLKKLNLIYLKIQSHKFSLFRYLSFWITKYCRFSPLPCFFPRWCVCPGELCNVAARKAVHVSVFMSVWLCLVFCFSDLCSEGLSWRSDCSRTFCVVFSHVGWGSLLLTRLHISPLWGLALTSLCSLTLGTLCGL